MSIVAGTKINRLLAQMHPSGLVFSSWLKTQGYSDQLQKRYRDNGWLMSLGKGVMYRTGSELSAVASLASCNKQTGTKMRVAAHSALEHYGFNHYVPMGKPVLCVGVPTGYKCPFWMNADCFDMTYSTFTTGIFTHPEIKLEENDKGKLYISSPEQAFLECLLLAPKQYDYLDLFYIMEQLTVLRSDIVQGLLENTNNIRVKRMFLYMAEKANHIWAENLDFNNINLGTFKTQLCEDGIYVPKYKMTIPKSLAEYE